MTILNFIVNSLSDLHRQYMNESLLSRFQRPFSEVPNWRFRIELSHRQPLQCILLVLFVNLFSKLSYFLYFIKFLFSVSNPLSRTLQAYLSMLLLSMLMGIIFVRNKFLFLDKQTFPLQYPYIILNDHSIK